MVAQAQDGFAGGLTRAMTIARTEILEGALAPGDAVIVDMARP
jgi:hypothetical protein